MRCLDIAQQAGLYHLPPGGYIMHLILCGVILAPFTVALLYDGIVHGEWSWVDLIWVTIEYSFIADMLTS